jgi:1,4-alpha-glucan branching enzyme
MIELLDYIRDLGFTALGPMPFTEFAGDHSWGYNPSYYLAAESSYGTIDELKALIDAAHARGLAVIKDIVFNHMDYASALYQLYGSDYEASPYFRLYTGENWGFPDVEQQTDAWKQHAADVIEWWLYEYRIDGFRYDATRFTEWSGYNDWGASWFAYAGKQADPVSIHIAEHLPEDPALQNETEMDTTWHAHFRWRIREMIENASLDRNAFRDVLDPTRLGFTNALQRIAYTESHDEERVMRHLEEKDFPPEETLRRAETALGLPLTAPGPAMIYAGQEFGENTRKFVGPNPLQWEKKETPGGQRLLGFTRAITTLRTTHPALRSTTIRFVDDLPENTAAYFRGDNEEILVAVNVGSSAATLDLSSEQPRSWRDAVSGDPIDLSDVHLLAGEIVIAVGDE